MSNLFTLKVSDLFVGKDQSKGGRFFTHFNGVNMRVSLPRIYLVTGSKFYMRFKSASVNPESLKILTDAETSSQERCLIYHDTSGNIVTKNVDVILDGTPINPTTKFPFDGKFHDIEVTVKETCILGTLFSRAATGGSNMEIIPEYLIVGDGSVHSYKFDEDASTGDRLINHGSGEDGTYLNRLESSIIREV